MGATVGARSIHESMQVAYLKIICSLYVLAQGECRSWQAAGSAAAQFWHGLEARGRRQQPIECSEHATACRRRFEEGEGNSLLPRAV